MSNSIAAAVAFLTRPLLRVHTPSTVLSLQAILTSTLQAAFIVPSSLESSILASSSQLTGHPELNLSLSPFELPPRPIYAACVAIGVRWCDWIASLGGVEFELSILVDRVTIRLGTAEKCIWELEPEPKVQVAQRVMLSAERPRVFVSSHETVRPGKKEQEHQVPISKLAINHRHHSSSIASSRTLAQELLELHQEEEETEEMFAMIGKKTIDIVSPTPTRERFMFGKAPAALATGFPYTSTYPYGSPISSPEPSSPSSGTARSELDDYSNDFEYDTFSDFSYASSEDEDDDDELSNLESQRFSFPKPSPLGLSSRIALPTVADMTAKTVMIPRLPNLTIAPHAVHSSASSVTSATSSTACSITMPSDIEYEEDEEDEDTQPTNVYIDTTRKAVTSYLYQGGKSIVLSGGVMLGAIGEPKQPASSSSTPAFEAANKPKSYATSLTTPNAKVAAAKPQTYKAPIGGRGAPGPRREAVRNSKADSFASWRRATAAAPALRA